MMKVKKIAGAVPAMLEQNRKQSFDIGLKPIKSCPNGSDVAFM